NRALEIKTKYNKIEPIKWGLKQDFMGLIKDIGDLSKILMVYDGYRNDFNQDTKKALEHELIDVLWAIIVIADKTEVDLKKSFYKTMNDLEKRLNKSA
ncbi:hypothetical protein KAS41_04635, partial [Candidatus Parcubacteria bacterium]|nr:hypothetical protein [Candidatus Parcubacteria bacterium]